ncbi:MAG: hypothetical protein J6O49_09610 [Bacteroidaceae bacterium]|nr:hypothetical protein [Bacteroidaceae bacterium]
MKKYLAPVTEIIMLEATSMVCASPEPGKRESEISDNSGKNDYQNPDWYQYDDTEDDDGVLNSQSKSSSLWDDFEDE